MDRTPDDLCFQIERDGKWVNVCLSDMTRWERMGVLTSKDKAYHFEVINRLCDEIREISKRNTKLKLVDGACPICGFKEYRDSGEYIKQNFCLNCGQGIAE